MKVFERIRGSGERKIEGVLYFDEISNSLRAVMASDPTHPRLLPGASPEIIAAVLSEVKDPTEQLFTFYDHRHITGTDIRQSMNAIALVTFAKDSSERDVLQGLMRMRKIVPEKTQSVHFVVSQEVKQILNQPLKVQTILDHAKHVNQDVNVRQSMTAIGQKMEMEVQSRVIVDLLDKFVSSESPSMPKRFQIQEWQKAFETLFVRDNSEHFAKDIKLRADQKKAPTFQDEISNRQTDLSTLAHVLLIDGDAKSRASKAIQETIEEMVDSKPKELHRQLLQSLGSAGSLKS